MPDLDNIPSKAVQEHIERQKATDPLEAGRFLDSGKSSDFRKAVRNGLPRMGFEQRRGNVVPTAQSKKVARNKVSPGGIGRGTS